MGFIDNLKSTIVEDWYGAQDLCRNRRWRLRPDIQEYVLLWLMSIPGLSKEWKSILHDKLVVLKPAKSCAPAIIIRSSRYPYSSLTVRLLSWRTGHASRQGWSTIEYARQHGEHCGKRALLTTPKSVLSSGTSSRGFPDLDLEETTKSLAMAVDKISAGYVKNMFNRAR